MALIDPKNLLKDWTEGKSITRLEHNYLLGLLQNEVEMQELKETANFKDYRELPFPTEIQDALFRCHRHDDEYAIIYDEKDVIAILKKFDKLTSEIIEDMRNLVLEGLPESCVRGETEIKFCTIRNGEGGGCKQCF